MAKATELDRFVLKIDFDECWKWTAYIASNGYGHFTSGGKSVLAHRYSYERFVGPIPHGLVIDHLCKEKSCVNPDHLEVVTPQENFQRGDAAKTFPGALGRRTHCPQGHPYDDENTYREPKTRFRRCRICQKKYKDDYRKRKKSEQLPVLSREVF